MVATPELVNLNLWQRRNRVDCPARNHVDELALRRSKGAAVKAIDHFVRVVVEVALT